MSINKVLESLVNIGRVEVSIRETDSQTCDAEYYVSMPELSRSAYGTDLLTAVETLAAKVFDLLRTEAIHKSEQLQKYKAQSMQLKQNMKEAGCWSRLMHPDYDGPETCAKCYGEMKPRPGYETELYCPACNPAPREYPCD